MDIVTANFTPFPVPHKCVIGRCPIKPLDPEHVCSPACPITECTFKGNRTFVVCTKNPRNVHYCGPTCPYLDENTDGETICPLTSSVQTREIAAPRPVGHSERVQCFKNSSEDLLKQLRVLLMALFEIVEKMEPKIIAAKIDVIVKHYPALKESKAAIKSFLSDTFKYQIATLKGYAESIARVIKNLVPLFLKRRTDKQLLLFTTVCCFLFRSGTVLPKIPAFQAFYMKTQIIQQLHNEFRLTGQFAPRCITEFQQKIQAQVKKFERDEPEKKYQMSAILKEHIPAALLAS